MESGFKFLDKLRDTKATTATRVLDVITDNTQARYMVDRFRSIVAEISPKVEDPESPNNLIPLYRFEYEDVYYMNKKSSRMYRTEPGVWLEEFEELPTTVRATGMRIQRYRLRPYFFDWAPDFAEQVDHGDTRHSIATKDTVTRQQVRDTIESEIVIPFINIIMHRANVEANLFNWFFPVVEVSRQYPPSKFDGREIGIQVSILLEVPICDIT